MPEQISEVFEVRSRYMRSINIERDFHDVKALNGYIVTPQTQSNLTRLITSLKPSSRQRAWRITGDYGTGKSSFALALAHLLSGQRKELPGDLHKVVDFRTIGAQRPQFLPVLVTGTRAPVGISILRALLHALTEICIRGKTPSIIKNLHSTVTKLDGNEITDKIIIEHIDEANKYLVSSGKGNGILIILDELGKFLEYAAMHPDKQDIFFLQSLAEAATRNDKSTLLIVGLLHQGFNAYSDQLSQVSQREWEKVAGRFEELLFDQPLEQMALLVSNALNVTVKKLPKDISKQAKDAMVNALEMRWYGASTIPKTLIDISDSLYPLHPTVLPVLINLFRRFGQNERSLFSFLLSSEPCALREYSNQPIESNCFYRIHHLYDYARAAFGHRLSVQSYRSHWNQIESLIESVPSEDELSLRILKTVAILNLLDVNTLIPTEEAIELAVDGVVEKASSQVKQAIRSLHKEKSILYYRGTAGGYCLWPHTSVNIEKAYETANIELGTPSRITPLIRENLETRPLVARRHYIKTGNLRHFEVDYCAVDDLEDHVYSDYDVSDGKILIPLCETEDERNEAISFVRKSLLKEYPTLLVAIPSPLSSLVGLIMEYQRWDWIAQNVMELNNDSYAAEEVSRQLTASQQVLERRMQSFIGLRQFSEKMDLLWYRQNKKCSISSGRELLAYLSDICDEVYNEAPIIHNELINRRVPSAAASGARLKLIDKMFTSSKEPYLGMDSSKKPPEMSLYLSFLEKSKLHGETSKGYDIVLPKRADDPCNMLSTLSMMMRALEENKSDRVNLGSLFTEMRKPPYGIRDGLIPLILSVFTLIHEHDIAYYENNAFMKKIVGEDFRRLIKAPDSFEVQLCRISGVRSIIFDHMIDTLKIEVPSGRKSDILDVVKPLMVFAAKLPKYTHTTKNLKPVSLSVRDTLLKARDPISLLFVDLPMACGYKPFEDRKKVETEKVNDFVMSVKDSLDDLRAAYPNLLSEITSNIKNVFEINGSFKKVREHLASASDSIIENVTELELKSFCLRLSDQNLSEDHWVESIGSLICAKPPDKWIDSDIDTFSNKLKILVERFKNVESMAFKEKGSSNRHAIRIGLTRSDGQQIDEVVYLNPGEETLAKDIEKSIVDILKNNKRVGIAAISRALWSVIS